MSSLCALSLMICLLFMGQVLSDGESDNVRDFFTVLNGDYDNSEQVNKEGNSFDKIQMKVIPVKVPALPGASVLYDEWAFNGELLNLCLNVITEDSDGAIRVAVHNITRQRKYKFGEYDIADLAKLTAQDIDEQKDCVGAFIPTKPGVFEGSWPDCRHAIKGKHPQYSDILRCDSADVLVPLTVDEKTTLFPYHLDRHGEKYPLIDAPADYKSPCSSVA